MAIQIQGQTGTVAEVDQGFRSQRVTAKPIDYGAFGHYRLAVPTGTLAAALGANTVVFSFRWGDATRLAVLTYLRVRFQTAVAFTAATTTDFGFDAYVGRSFTAAHTGGTALTLTGHSFKVRTNMGTTLASDIRVATTAALGGGTVTLDPHAFATSIGKPNVVNAAAATEYQLSSPPQLDYSPNGADGEHPLVMSQSEGFVIRNRTVWPAAGTGIVVVECGWCECLQY